jgi:hypothetical protein
MTSAELVTGRSEAERLVALGATATDLTIVYGTHGDVDDAQRSLAYVEPDSVVFLEGYTIQPHANLAYERGLMVLNDYRLRSGKDSAEYQNLKQALLGEVTAHEKDYVPSGPLDFMANTFSKLKGLLQKDCLIYYADHKDIALAEAEEFNQQFRKDAAYIANVDLPRIESESGVGRAIKHLRASVKGELLAHALRESRAAIALLIQVADIARSYDTASLMKANGKLKSYLLYGTAHARSLTWQFTSRGMRPQVVEVEPLSEELYIDTLMAPDYNNHGRRLGYVALRSLTYDLLEPESARTITSESYEHLAFLNTATDDELRSFIVTCALAKRAENRNAEEALRQYYSILRSFMPRPEDFIA